MRIVRFDPVGAELHLVTRAPEPFGDESVAEALGLNPDSFSADADSGAMAALLDDLLGELQSAGIWKVTEPFTVTLKRYATVEEPGIEMLPLVWANGATLAGPAFGLEECMRDDTSGITAAVSVLEALEQDVNRLAEYAHRLLIAEPLDAFCGYCHHHQSNHDYGAGQQGGGQRSPSVPCVACPQRRCFR